MPQLPQHLNFVLESFIGQLIEQCIRARALLRRMPNLKRNLYYIRSAIGRIQPRTIDLRRTAYAFFDKLGDNVRADVGAG